MGIRDRLVKALALPAGATTQTPEQIIGQSAVQGSLAAPLDRDPSYGATPFGPGNPLFPFLINQPRSDGRADPRRWEFPVAWNLQLQGDLGKAVPFRVLREVADHADIVRKCVETVKNAIVGMDWDVAISETAIGRMMAERNVGGTDAARLVREQYADQIVAVKDFWRQPDRINGLTFQEWLGMLLEEVIVIDALTIYPNQMAGQRNLASLEILDGATIKPLLDARGSRPIPPHPAYQQILWGFPRGEFTASADADGEFTADDVIYAPRTRRPFTPYGLSPVERALPLIDLYLKRLHWLRTEYTDGVPPDMLLKTDATFGNNPELLRGYERVFNDQLAGNLEERRHAKVLPNGMDPVFNPSSDAKYSADFDEWLVKSITGHFGILPSQIGFTPKGGLGGAGHQEGEAASTETLGLRPLLTWVTELLNQLSHRFLSMPRDLTFVFNDGTEDDEMAQATRRQLELFSGQKTWNEVRTEAGLPLFTFPEADAPLVVNGGSVLPLAAAFEAVTVDAVSQDNDDEDDTLGENEKAELATFVKWAKAERDRPFAFSHLDADMAAELNLLVRCDAHAARHLASSWKAGGVRPKAFREPYPEGHPARQRADELASLYARRLASVGLVDAERLAAQFLADPADDPRAWLRARKVRVFDTDRMEKILRDLYTEAAWMGVAAARVIRTARKAVAVIKPVDWGSWTPGDPKAAERLLGATGGGEGWRDLLAETGATVQGISNTRLDMIGSALSFGIDRGASVDEIARDIRGIVGSSIRAEMIAHTEMTRAGNAATMTQFRKDGASKVEWESAGDGDVCDECAENADGGPYPIDEAPQPPAHPWCGCQLIAVEFDNEDEYVDAEAEEPEKAVQADLTKAGRNAVDRALARLDELPDAEPGLIAVPWPRRERPKVPNESWADSHLHLWPIEALCATQRFVKRDTVRWHLENLGIVREGAHSNPNVIVVDGEPCIYDGHHRLAALWLLYVVATNCWTLEVEP